MGYRVAVVGATGNVGREMLNILAERQFPLDEVAALASSRSTGDVIDFGDSGEELKVRNLEHFDFAGWDIALFAAGSEVSKIYAPKAAAAGCTVIDNSSLYRMDPDVPLIVPEVLTKVARTPLSELAATTGLLAKLSVRDGDHAVTVFRVGRPPPGGLLRSGDSMHLAVGATGSALLCGL